MSDTEKIYSLNDLRTWTRESPSFAVLGKPIAHSLSPKMHNAAFSTLKKSIPALSDRRYFRFEIAPEELSVALPLFLEKNFLGLNLTIPHKVAAVSLLHSISETAKMIGAANTLARKNNDNSWHGENTDGRGFSIAVEKLRGKPLAETPIVLLGAGGAARAIATIALAENCASLTIANRSRDRAEKLVDNLNHYFPRKKIVLRGEFSPEENSDIPKNALVINATSLGLKRDDPSPFPSKLLCAEMSVYDTTYGPSESKLVTDARNIGALADDGRSMLAWQGALAFENWNNVPAKEVFPIFFAKLHS